MENYHHFDNLVPNLFQKYLSTVNDELEYYYPSVQYNVESHLQKAITDLIENYSVQGLKKADSLNFNHIELRCAYMYLYSTSHSHMVIDALSRYHRYQLCYGLWPLLSSGEFNITSLGGGPGSDPLGILVFMKRFGILSNWPQVSVSVVDEYQEWERPFHSLMKDFSDYLYKKDFITQDLLQPFSWEVVMALMKTQFLSMVKFISAISGNPGGTLRCLSRVFTLIPVGSLVLIIDNAGGNDFQRALDIAYSCGMEAVFGPITHVKFKIAKALEPAMNKVARFGKKSQTGSTVSMTILQKFSQKSSYGNLMKSALFKSCPSLSEMPGTLPQSPAALLQSPPALMQSPPPLIRIPPPLIQSPPTLFRSPPAENRQPGLLDAIRHFNSLSLTTSNSRSLYSS